MNATNGTSATDASAAADTQRDWAILAYVAVACMVLALPGLTVNVAFLHEEDKQEYRTQRYRKSYKAAAMLLLTILYIGSSRYVSVLDLFTDVIFAKELKAKGHPNYHTFAVVILILPFAALYLLVGYVFVEKYAKEEPEEKEEEETLWLEKRSRTQLILLWLLLGWFVIAATELLLFTYFLLVPNMAKAVLGYEKQTVNNIDRTVGIFVWFEDYLVNYGRLRVITEILFEGLPFLVFYAYVLFYKKEESLVAENTLYSALGFSILAVVKNIYGILSGARLRKISPVKYMGQIFKAGVGVNPLVEQIVKGDMKIVEEGA